MSPPTPEAQRLRGMASSLRRIRVVCALFTVLQFSLYVPPSGLVVPYPLWPIAVAIIVWLLLTNLLSAQATRTADRDQLKRLARAEVAADAIVALAIVTSFNFDPTLRLWPVLSLPILEAAMRFSLRPTLGVWGLVGGIYALDQIRLMPTREDPATWIGHIPYALGILLIIGLISGMLSSRLERARGRAERSAQQLRHLSAFSRDLSATRLTDQVVTELLHAAVSLTAVHHAEYHETADAAWRCVRRLDAKDGAAVAPVSENDLDTLGRDPHAVRTIKPDTGEFTQLVLMSVPRGEGPFASLVLAADEADAELSEDDLDVLKLLIAQATVALNNAALIEREADTIEQLRALHALKDDFVSILTHELRSPLTSVSGYAELLRSRGDQIDPDERDQFLEAIERNGNELIRLIDDVLDATRADQQRLAVSSENVDLGPIVSGLAEEQVGPSPRHRLDLRVEDDLPPVTADPDRVRQVVRNLLTNAVKYSPDGGRIAVELERDGDAVVLRVIDDGVGIPEHLQGQLFQKFSRLPSRARVKGTGLGLFLCRELVERMGGEIGVHSEPDRGSTFWVRLPTTGELPGRSTADHAQRA